MKRHGWTITEDGTLLLDGEAIAQLATLPEDPATFEEKWRRLDLAENAIRAAFEGRDLPTKAGDR